MAAPSSSWRARTLPLALLLCHLPGVAGLRVHPEAAAAATVAAQAPENQTRIPLARRPELERVAEKLGGGHEAGLANNSSLPAPASPVRPDGHDEKRSSVGPVVRRKEAPASPARPDGHNEKRSSVVEPVVRRKEAPASPARPDGHDEKRSSVAEPVVRRAEVLRPDGREEKRSSEEPVVRRAEAVLKSDEVGAKVKWFALMAPETKHSFEEGLRDIFSTKPGSFLVTDSMKFPAAVLLVSLAMSLVFTWIWIQPPWVLREKQLLLERPDSLSPVLLRRK